MKKNYVFFYFFCTITMLGVCGCEKPPVKNYIISQATNTDTHDTALLFQRRIGSAIGGDEFFLVLVPKGKEINKFMNNFDVHAPVILVANFADKVKLKWSGRKNLIVLCNNCGLEQIDISEKHYKFKYINVIYSGFPNGTIDDLTDDEIQEDISNRINKHYKLKNY